MLYSRKIKIWKETGDTSVIHTSKWNEFDQRIEKIQKRLTALINHLEGIRLTIHYLKLHNLDNFLSENEIPRSEYSKFIYDSHQIRMVSTLDILAKLGDLVYETKIPLRYCNWNSFVNHVVTKNTKTAQILDEFSTIIWTNKFERNQIIHSGDYTSPIINSIWSTEIDDNYLDKDSILKMYFKKAKSQNIEELISRMNKNYDQALKYSIDFVNSMANVLESSLKLDNPY